MYVTRNFITWIRTDMHSGANANDNFLAAFTGVRYLISQNSKLDSSKYELDP